MIQLAACSAKLHKFYRRTHPHGIYVRVVAFACDKHTQLPSELLRTTGTLYYGVREQKSTASYTFRLTVLLLNVPCAEFPRVGGKDLVPRLVQRTVPRTLISLDALSERAMRLAAGLTRCHIAVLTCCLLSSSSVSGKGVTLPITRRTGHLHSRELLSNATIPLHGAVRDYGYGTLEALRSLFATTLTDHIHAGTSMQPYSLVVLPGALK